jgi:hypothetical protein
MMTSVLESALRTAVTVGLVWVILKLFRVTHVVSQKIAWSLVLIAALAMPSVMRWHAFRFSLPMALRSYPTIWPSTEAAFPQVQTTQGATSNSLHPAIQSLDTRSSPGLRMAKLNHFIAGIYLTILRDPSFAAASGPYVGVPGLAPSPAGFRLIENPDEG